VLEEVAMPAGRRIVRQVDWSVGLDDEEGFDCSVEALVPRPAAVHELIVPRVEGWRAVGLRVLVVQAEHHVEIARAPCGVDLALAAEAARFPAASP